MTQAGSLYSMDMDPENGVEQIFSFGAAAGFSVSRSIAIACATPPGEWCNEASKGAVLIVLTGEAAILVKGEATPRILVSGDYLVVSEETPYRVEWTHPSDVTMSLSIRGSSSAALESIMVKSPESLINMS